MIRMSHHDPRQTGGPTEAEVPPGGVEMMIRQGWRVVEPAAPPAESDLEMENLSVKQLRALARDGNIPLPAEVNTKAEIIACLAERMRPAAGQEAQNERDQT